MFHHIKIRARHLLCFVAATILPFATEGQTDNAKDLLSGYVIDYDDGEGIPNASVAILNKDNKVITFSMCGDDGKFIIPLRLRGSFSINITRVGYEDSTSTIDISEGQSNLGSFRLQRGRYTFLDEIVVIANIKKTSPNKIVYDVGQDSTAYGKSVVEVMERIPFIRVDKATRELSVMGQTDFVITVNGGRNLFLTEANQYVAKLLDAQQLKEIELIISPEGKYADHMAVINIITKENDLPDGVVLNGYMNVFNGGMKINVGGTSKINDLILNVNYIGNSYDTRRLHEKTTWIDFVNADSNIAEQTRSTSEKSHNFVFRASYDLSQYSLLTFSGNVNHKKNTLDLEGVTHIYDMDETELDSYSFNSHTDQTYDIIKGSLNYQRSFRSNPEKLFTMTYSFEKDITGNEYRYSSAREQDIADEPLNDKNDFRLTEHTAGADFYFPAGNRQNFFITGKYNHRYYDSYGSVELLEYTQHVAGFSGGYSLNFDKTMLRAELSLEYTRNRIRFNEVSDNENYYFYMMPGLFFLHQISKKSTFSLEYEAPSFRPDIRYLNPFADITNPSHYYVGNPALKPEKKHNATVKYRFFTSKFDSYISAGYSYSRNAVYAFDMIDEEGILISSYDNIGKSQSLKFDMGFSLTPYNDFELWADCSAIYTNYSHLDLKYPLWNFKAATVIVVPLWKDGYVQSGVWLAPISQSVQNSRYHYYIGYNVRFGHDFRNDIYMMVDMQNLFDKHLIITDEKKTAEFYSYQVSQIRGRLITVSIGLTFGRLKNDVKTGKRTIINKDRER